MAEAADEEIVMEVTREETQVATQYAYDQLADPLKEMLAHAKLTPAEETTTLLKLACGISCMATTMHRQLLKKQNEDDEISEGFYEQTQRMMVSMLRDLLPFPRGEDWKVQFGDGVREKLASDPEMNNAVTRVIEEMRGALDGVATGKYASVAEAMDAIGARRVSADEVEEITEKIDNADKDTLQ